MTPLDAQAVEVVKLQASDGAAGESFGYRVSISGDRALVGAPFDDDLGDFSGSAYVFERDAEGNWTEVAKLLAGDGVVVDEFGWAVSLYGDRALVGAYGNDDLGSDSGSAYVFERDAEGVWTEVAKLLPSDGFPEDRFGVSVSLFGDRALVGAYLDDVLAFDSGSAYVFERDAGGTWTEVAKLAASDGEEQDHFGTRVSISGHRALVGAYRDDDVGQGGGSAYLFERDAGGTWIQVGKLLPGDGAAFGSKNFGLAVSISRNRALVGAPGDADLGFDSGSAYVFERDAAGVWTETAKLLAHDGAADDEFGASVSVSGDRAVVGAYREDDLGSEAGSAYVFERQPGGAWTQVEKLQASDAAAADWFGAGVSISGDRTLVGAPLDDDQGSASGSAYVFEDPAGGASLPASEVVRLGSPPNPNALLPGLTGGPVLGSVWEPIIDHTTFLAGADFDLLGLTVQPLNLHAPPFGTLLCDPAATVASATVAAGVSFAVLFPSTGALAGASLCAQGASVDALGTIRLTNALDITIGTF